MAVEERRGEGRVATNLDVVVRSGCGEAAGDGVEVEAEHRLLVVPVDLQRPAPHLVEWWWMGLRRSGVPPQRISPPPLALARCLRLQSPSLSHTHTTHSLSLSRVWIGGKGNGQRREVEGTARAPLALLPRPCKFSFGFWRWKRDLGRTLSRLIGGPVTLCAWVGRVS